VIDLPLTAIGHTTFTATVRARDNLDAVSAFGQLTYDAGLVLQYPAAGNGIAFDNLLTRVAMLPFSATPFIQDLQLSDGSSPIPTATTVAGRPTAVEAAVIDAAGRVGATGTVPLGSVVAMRTTGAGAYANDFTGGFALSASPLSLSNCSGTCASNPSTTTLTASARGTTGTFTNPFDAVQFWYQPAAGAAWQLAGTASGAAVSDNGVNRTWTYALIWDPPLSAAVRSTGSVPSLAPALGQTIAVQIRAIGITLRGDAVASPAVTITLTNP
jgi:hypothetical protein